MKIAIATTLALALSTAAASAETVAPPAAALSPYAATKLGHRPRSTRMTHCEKKADSVRVAGKARDIYMRKCTRG